MSTPSLSSRRRRKAEMYVALTLAAVSAIGIFLLDDIGAMAVAIIATGFFFVMSVVIGLAPDSGETPAPARQED